MTSTSDPAALLRRPEWRFRHSAWMLAVFLGFGLLSFVGFVYIALRARTRRLWIAALTTSLASGSVWVVSYLLDPPRPSGSGSAAATATEGSGVTAGLAMAVWAGSIVYAFIVNRAYLRWRAGAGRRAWFDDVEAQTRQLSSEPLATPPVGTPIAHPLTASSLMDADAGKFFAPSPVPTADAPGHPRAAPSTMVDANTVTGEELTRELAIDSRLAARVIAVRDARSGFTDFDDLVASVRLQPHELVRLKDRLWFSSTDDPGSADRPPAGQGRLLDY